MIYKKKHPDGHFAMASVKFARELANLSGDNYAFFLSQDDKVRVPLGLPISKKETAILMHLEYKVMLPDHILESEPNTTLFHLFMQRA